LESLKQLASGAATAETAEAVIPICLKTGDATATTYASLTTGAIQKRRTREGNPAYGDDSKGKQPYANADDYHNGNDNKGHYHNKSNDGVGKVGLIKDLDDNNAGDNNTDTDGGTPAPPRQGSVAAADPSMGNTDRNGTTTAVERTRGTPHKRAGRRQCHCPPS
jgi:hypothetical protein